MFRFPATQKAILSLEWERENTEENAEYEGLAMLHMKTAHKSMKNGHYSELDL